MAIVQSRVRPVNRSWNRRNSSASKLNSGESSYN